MKRDFVMWIKAELDKRGWSRLELAQRSSLAASSISMILSEQRGPGLQVCVGIARALKFPPEVVLRKAGLIPALPGGQDEVSQQEMLQMFKSMTPKQRCEARDYIEYLYQKTP